MKMRNLYFTVLIAGIIGCGDSESEIYSAVEDVDIEVEPEEAEPEETEPEETEPEEAEPEEAEPEEAEPEEAEPEETEPESDLDVMPTDLKASWMQGHWGVSFRISGGDISQNESHVNEYQVKAAVEQLSEIPGLKWLQLNLTNGAFGDRFIVPVDEVEAVNPNSTPNSIDDLYDSTIKGTDLFEQMAMALQEKGIRVVAYIATQGPSMLKHGAKNSMDYDNSIIDESDGSACKESSPEITDLDTQVYCSSNMNRWRDYVLQQYPSTSLYHSFQLALVNIVQTLSIRYGELIDGWWFDHAMYGDYDLLPAAARAGNSNAALAFNLEGGVSLKNNPDVPEDFTGGHPTPIAESISSDDINLPMLTAIESTKKGVFEGVGDDIDVVGHMFMPLQETWNGGTVVFSEEKGSEWLDRVTSSGGAITWALSHDGNVSGGEALLVSEAQAKVLTRMQLNLGKQLDMNLNGADEIITYDDSINQYTATVTGASFIDDIIRGKVASFNQTDQIMLNNYVGVLGDSARTTMAWLKTSDNKADFIQWGQKETGKRWSLGLDNGVLKLDFQNSTIIGTTILNDKTWHHIAVVASDNIIGNIKVYIDGVLEVFNISNGALVKFNTTADANVKIGGEYTGLLDKVVVYNRSLDKKEIDYIVNSQDADTDFTVALNVDFEEAFNSPIIMDHSVYKRNGINRGINNSVFDATRNGYVYSFTGNDNGEEVDDLYDSDYEHEVVMTTDNTKNNKGYSGVNGGEPRTVMAWIKTTLSGRVIVNWGNKEAVNGERYIVRLKVGKLRLDIKNGRVDGTTLINDGEWHHIAVVSPDENLANTKIYIDGVLEDIRFSGSERTINTLTLNGESHDVVIGGNFIGEIDDFFIYQRALKPFEIKAAVGL